MLFIRYFFSLWCSVAHLRDPSGCSLFPRCGLMFSVLLTAFCMSSVNARVGSNSTNFELFTSTGVTKTCRNKTMLTLFRSERVGVP